MLLLLIRVRAENRVKILKTNYVTVKVNEMSLTFFRQKIPYYIWIVREDKLN